MKRILLIIPLFIILFSGNIIAGSCSPESDLYDNCWYNCYGTACAYIQTSTPYDSRGIKNVWTQYYVGYAKVNAKCSPGSGGTLYRYQGGFSNWDAFWNYADCDSGGCYNYEKKLSDTAVDTIATIGDSNVECTIYVCHYDDGSYWTTAAYGWTANPCHFGFTVVECISDSDCPGSDTCNPSSHSCVSCTPDNWWETEGCHFPSEEGHVSCPSCVIPNTNGPGGGGISVTWDGSTQSIHSALDQYDSEEYLYAIWFWDGCGWFIYSPGPAPDTLTELKNGYCYGFYTNNEIPLGTVSGNLILDFMGLILSILKSAFGLS